VKQYVRQVLPSCPACLDAVSCELLQLLQPNANGARGRAGARVHPDTTRMLPRCAFHPLGTPPKSPAVRLLMLPCLLQLPPGRGRGRQGGVGCACVRYSPRTHACVLLPLSSPAARWRGWRRCRWPAQHRGGRGGAGSKQQGWPQARKRVGGELGARRSSCCHPPRQAALVHEPRPARARLLQLPLLAVADEAAAVLAFVGLLALLAPLRGVRGVGGGAACWLAAACWQCCLLHACLGVVQGWLRVCARVSPLSFGRRLTSLGGPPPTHASRRSTVQAYHACHSATAPPMRRQGAAVRGVGAREGVLSHRSQSSSGPLAASAPLALCMRASWVPGSSRLGACVQACVQVHVKGGRGELRACDGRVVR